MKRGAPNLRAPEVPITGDEAAWLAPPEYAVVVDEPLTRIYASRLEWDEAVAIARRAEGRIVAQTQTAGRGPALETEEEAMASKGTCSVCGGEKWLPSRGMCGKCDREAQRGAAQAAPQGVGGPNWGRMQTAGEQEPPAEEPPERVGAGSMRLDFEPRDEALVQALETLAYRERRSLEQQALVLLEAALLAPQGET